MSLNITISLIKKGFLTPLLAMKLRYFPLLMIYFAYGAQAITGVALTFGKRSF